MAGDTWNFEELFESMDDTGRARFSRVRAQNHNSLSNEMVGMLMREESKDDLNELDFDL